MAHTDLWPRKTDCSFTTSTPLPIELELDGCCSLCLPVILHPLLLSLFLLPLLLPLLPPLLHSEQKQKEKEKIEAILVS